MMLRRLFVVRYARCVMLGGSTPLLYEFDTGGTYSQTYDSGHFYMGSAATTTGRAGG